MVNTKTGDITGFSDLGIKETILKVIADLGLTTPTPIQHQAIPAALSGQDIVGIAQTGTGKTFAFGIPMLQRLALVKGRGLVLLPTRELAGQVENSLAKLGGPLGLRTVSLIGGEAIGRQIFGLRRRPHILVATPGRLIDHIKRGTVRLDDISVLVLDEADMMFDMGFAPQIEEVLKTVPANRQTLLFSATMPAAVMRLAEKHLRTPMRVEVSPAGSTAELVEQEIYILPRDNRYDQVITLLGEYRSSVLIFVRTKHGATKLAKKLQQADYSAAEIHSNLSFAQRQASLAGFRSGKHRILVATDVAARGLDINDIELVLNYDLPDNSEDYVHRIGRTARAGKKGKAISFAAPDQRRDIMKIEQLIRKTLPVRNIKSGFATQFARGNKTLRPTQLAGAKPFKKFERPVSEERRNKRQRPDAISEVKGKDNTPFVFEAPRRVNKAERNYSSLGFRKRPSSIDVLATPDYLQPSGKTSTRREYKPSVISGGMPAPVMTNPEFDGGNRFAFRRKMFKLKEEAKGHARRVPGAYKSAAKPTAKTSPRPDAKPAAFRAEAPTRTRSASSHGAHVRSFKGRA
ncbi:MAG: DEAD/DEAH box helicase [bacterium]|nr:DEAD/DEAH box helicase [bacterium]